MTGTYYSDKLTADRLRQCYELAPPRVKQYLAAEIDHVIGRIQPGMDLLELGCGYGRALKLLASEVSPNGLAIGIDTSAASLELARSLLARTFHECS